MIYRALGRTGWQVSEIGYGMWGVAGWTGSDDDQSLQSLNLAVELGCNFFDTAYAYGDGHSERLLGQLVAQHPQKKLYTATKIPPRNRQWPSQRCFPLQDVFPPDYIREMTEKSLKNLGADHLDLQQFHVWEDAWARDERWQRIIPESTTRKIVNVASETVSPQGARSRSSAIARGGARGDPSSAGKLW